MKKVHPVALRSLTALTLRLASILCGIVSTAVLARSLSIEDYGIFALGLTVLAMAGQLGDFGMTTAVAAEASARPDEAARIGSSGVLARLLLSAIGAAIAITASLLWADESQSLVIAILVVCAPLGSAGTLAGLSNAEMKPHVASGLTFAQAVLWLATVAVISTHATSPAPYALGFVGCTSAQVAFTLVIYARRGLLVRPSAPETVLVLRRALPAGLLGLLVTAYYRLGTILLSVLRGNEETALYAAAFRFIDVIQILPALLVVPLLAVLTRPDHTPERRKSSLLALCRVATAVGILGGLFLTTCAPLLVRLLFGDRFEGAVLPLKILGLAFVPIVLGYVATTASFASRSTWRQLRRVAVIAPVSIALQIPAVQMYGATGAAAMAVLTELAVCLVALKMSAASWGVTLGGTGVVRALVVAVPSFVAMILAPGWWVLSAAAVGLAVMFASRVITLSTFKLLVKGRS